MLTVALEDFAKAVGASAEDIPGECERLLRAADFRYRTLDKEERDELILRVIKKIESGKLSVTGKHRKNVWDKGWGEILEKFIESDYDIAELTPQYFKPAPFIRFSQDYVAPNDPMFELKWLEVVRTFLFKKYLQGVDNVYEFGCGTGHNLAALAKLFPEKKLYGLDWVKPSSEILGLLKDKHGFNIKGYLFDIFSPDAGIELADNSAIFTIQALEQVGSNFEDFLSFIFKKSPAICINMEPIEELYDENNLVDYLAVKFQKKRNYLTGYLNRIYELQDEGKVDIIKVQRVSLGSLYLDAYSYVVWKTKI